MSHFSLPSFRRVPSCPRCGRRLRRHGDRRWLCPRCRRSFRFHHRKRGPKRRLRGLVPATVQRFLAGRHSVRSLTERGRRSVGATHRRLRRGLRRLRGSLPPAALPERGSLLVIADAVWRRIRGRRVTLYLILVRLVRSDLAVLAVLLAREEWECEAGWRAAVGLLDTAARRRVRGATIDEHAGLRNALRALGGPRLPIQWCQFHCVAEFLRKLGKKTMKRDPVAAQVWAVGRRVLAEPNPAARAGLCRYLHALAGRSDCPPRTRRAARWFLGRVPKVTVCFRYPRRSMPATTGAAESVAELLRKFLHRIRPQSLADLQTACDLFRRLHPTVRCTSKSHRNR